MTSNENENNVFNNDKMQPLSEQHAESSQKIQSECEPTHDNNTQAGNTKATLIFLIAIFY